MKKASILVVLLVALSFSFEAKAQVYYVYDGGSFNILLTCNSGSVVQKISFSSNGQWVDFSITNWTNTSNGFLYTVQDGVGKYFTILYNKNQDFITVTNVSSGASWRQNRR